MYIDEEEQEKKSSQKSKDRIKKRSKKDRKTKVQASIITTHGSVAVMVERRPKSDICECDSFYAIVLY